MNKIKEYFNDQAKTWDITCKHDEFKIQSILNLIMIESQKKILDIGCGTGILEKFLLKYDPEKIVAIDLADQMIEIAKTKYQNSIIDFKVGDILELKLEKFDYIIIHNAFPHIFAQDILFKKVYDCLENNGKFIICHSIGRNRLNSIHKSKANNISLGLEKACIVVEKLKELFQIEIMIDTNEYYMIMGIKK